MDTINFWWGRNQKIILLGLSILLGFILFIFLIHAASSESVLGADFYTFWMAGKAVFLEHADPYSQVITNQIQLGILGRFAQPGEDQLAFSYPPHSLIAILPAVYMSFDWAAAFWLGLNLSVLILIIFVLPKQVRSYLLTTLLFYPVFLCLVMGAFDILTASGIILYYGMALAQKRTSSSIQILSGILLAWATIKPQFIWLVLGYTLLLAFREKHQAFLKSFGVSIIIFLMLAFLLVPDWVPSWLQQVSTYAQYVNSRPTIAEFFIPFFSSTTTYILSGIAFLLSAATAIILTIRWWQGLIHWLKPLAWLCMMTFLFHLHGIAYEQIIFIIPLILWIVLRGQWKSRDVIFFWGVTILASWVFFVYGMQHIAIDRAPILFNLVWVGWLLRKPGFQL